MAITAAEAIVRQTDYIMSKEIAAEAALENCRALIDRINAALSAEKPHVNVSTAAELLFHLELAASALKETRQIPGHTHADMALRRRFALN